MSGFKGEAITFGRLQTWTLTFFYRKDTDFLTIRAPWQQDGVWVDLPDKVRIKVDSQNGEALEFQIANFQRNFLARRPDLEPLWAQIRPSPIALRRRENTPFIDRFLEHIEQLTYQRDKEIHPGDLPRSDSAA